MSIDWLIEKILLPIIKYPVFLCAVLGIQSKKIRFFSMLYSLALYCSLKYNTSCKLHGQEKWAEKNSVKHHNVLITGGSSGLGLSIVNELLSTYKNLTIFNIDIKASPVTDIRIRTYSCDLSNSMSRDKTIKKIKQDVDRPMDLIINNAGMRSKYQTFENIKESDFDQILAVNTLAPAKIIQSFVPKENDKNQCYVVTVASTLGLLSPAKIATYSASKAALIALHRSFSHELCARSITNIRTLLVIPGQLNTKLFGGFDPPRQFFAPIVDSDDLARKILDSYKIGKRGDLHAPFYSKLSYLFMSLPYVVQILARKLAQVDDCLPDD